MNEPSQKPPGDGRCAEPGDGAPGDAAPLARPRTRAVVRYRETWLTESDPLRKVVLLYDGAIRFVGLAANAIEAGDTEGGASQANRALEIVAYLRSRLDESAPPARLYGRLYAEVCHRIIDAAVARDALAMRCAAGLLAPLRDAWARHACVDAAASVAAEGRDAIGG